VKRTTLLAVLLALVLPLPAAAARQKAAEKDEKKKEEEKGGLNASTFAGLEFRSLGPALTSGRIVDIAVDPADHGTWYVAAASGGVWKTINAGTTWQPVFDGEGSYSIGALAIDPKNPAAVWVGTGENNSQRSVGYGDGIYKSDDAGGSWTNLGLKDSQHIGMIRIDPRDSKVVYVASQGPLWNDGGDRGLYKTADYGKTWSKILDISPRTGVSEVHLDPRDPDTLYAVAYQRRRHVWTLIDGGPESGLHKSTDGGKTWSKLSSGLPKEDIGRIGLAVSPVDPDILYAIVEAANKAGGIFRSLDRGATWEKRADYVSTSPQYYQELFADPVHRDRVYSMDTFLKVSDDGGKTWRNLGQKHRHVDDHAMWIDPRDNDHYIVGGDGGLYETFDRGATWKFFPNLPLTQFYKIAVDNDSPIYHVYGGTQDNFTLGGPVRTFNQHGIQNSDWFVTWSGDGFQPRVDPKDSNIVYSQLQHGVLGRYDRRTGEAMLIQPQEGKGEPPLRWNWDSPLIISPHSHTRLYFAANRLYRSDDRGDSWRPVSGDLTRQVDRNQLPVMGRVWPADAVAKNASTSFYGNIVALDESPLQEGLLYVGTDDGLVQVSEDGGASWRKVERFPGVPDNTYVSRLTASRFDRDAVYAAFNNHKMGDFKPYLLRSGDRGRSWSSIAGDLPDRGSLWAVVEDPARRDLLYAGTEFGAFFTPDGGKRWVRLKGGLPTIAVRDLAIQERENDLVLGTFGRGFYVLEDLAPLQKLAEPDLRQEALLLEPASAWMYVPASPLGLRGAAFQGEAHYLASNPPYGAVFTYYLKDEIKTRKASRQEREKKDHEAEKTPPYPSQEELRAEAAEEPPAILLTVTDAEGQVVRRLSGPPKAGFHQVEWDLRLPAAHPASLEKGEDDLFSPGPEGPLVLPGTYQVSLAKRIEGQITPLASPRQFHVASPVTATLAAGDRAELLSFLTRVQRLQRAVLGAARTVEDTDQRVKLLKKALEDTPSADLALASEARAIEARLRELKRQLEGDRVIAQRNYPVPAAITDRVQSIVDSHWYATSAPTQTSRQAYDIAAEEFSAALAELRQLVETDLAALEAKAEAAGAPWTPGRVPMWTKE
jgi:photosystem II stability/assembly factor-like uncharacterized protein